MNIATSILFNTTFGKWFFTSIYGVTTALIMQDATVNGQSFLDSLLSNVPAQVLYILGIVYAIVVVLKYISKAWKDHKINLLEIKIKTEELSQEKIHTSKDSQELKSVKNEVN